MNGEGGAKPVLPPTLARSWNGALVDLDAPAIATISLEDVALSLSTIKRWNGHTSRPLSVLEHSLAVAEMVPARLRLAALLHDAHEYMTGDGTRPFAATQGVKLARRLSALCGLPDAVVIREAAAATDDIKRGLDLAIGESIFAAAGMDAARARTEAAELAHEMRGPAVKRADTEAGEIEAAEMFGREAFRVFDAEEPDLGRLREQWLRYVRDCAKERVLDVASKAMARPPRAVPEAELSGADGAPVAACGDGVGP